MPEPMASEPAEPTTRQQCEREGMTPIPDHGVLLIDCTVHGPVGVIVAGDDEYGRAEAAFAKHLLADPAQTTELEQLRAGGAKLLAVTEEFQQQRDLLLWLHAEAAWRVVGFDALTAALARHLKEAQAERDALSLLLRGMARKLVDYRKWTLGDDVPEVHRLRRELAEARARKQADLDELKRTLGLTRNTLKQNVEWRDRFRAERDEDRAELGETRRERDLLLWLHAEAAWRVAGFDVLTVALARRNHQLTAERDELQARIEEHEDLLATIWLYVKWRYVTKQLTTEQKNLWADAVEKVSERHHPGEGAEADRWWQDETTSLSGEALRDAEERDDAAGDLP